MPFPGEAWLAPGSVSCCMGECTVAVAGGGGGQVGRGVLQQTGSLDNVGLWEVKRRRKRR